MPNNGKFQHQQVTGFEKLFIGFFIELRLCNLSYQSKIGILASKRKNPAISAGHFAYVNVGARILWLGPNLTWGTLKVRYIT